MDSNGPTQQQTHSRGTGGMEINPSAPLNRQLLQA